MPCPSHPQVPVGPHLPPSKGAGVRAYAVATSKHTFMLLACWPFCHVSEQPWRCGKQASKQARCLLIGAAQAQNAHRHSCILGIALLHPAVLALIMHIPAFWKTTVRHIEVLLGHLCQLVCSSVELSQTCSLHVSKDGGYMSASCWWSTKEQQYVTCFLSFSA